MNRGVKLKRQSRPLPMFEVGDLVESRNEINRVWEIEGYFYEYMYLHGKEHEEIQYNLLCVKTSESKLETEDDLVLLCPSSFAQSYLRNTKMDNTVVRWSNIISSEEESHMKRSGQSKLKLTEKQKESMVDDILDRYNDTMRFIEMDGEVTDIMQAQLNTLQTQWEHVTGATLKR